MVRGKAAGPEQLQQKGVTCCYAKADKFWVRDADGVPWEMYALLADADAQTAADAQLRDFLGQSTGAEAARPSGQRQRSAPCADRTLRCVGVIPPAQASPDGGDDRSSTR